MNYTKKHILSLLADYADFSKQRYEWGENLQRTHFTPTELIEEWFSDIFGAGHENLIARGEINEAEWTVIRPFYALFEMFADHFARHESSLPADLTLHDQWLLVMSKASETKKELEGLGWSLKGDSV